MMRRPKSVFANVILLLAAIAVTPMLVSIVVSPWSAWVWVVIAIVASAMFLLFLRHRRVEAAKEAAWDESLSFGVAVARRRAEATRAVARTA